MTSIRMSSWAMRPEFSSRGTWPRKYFPTSRQSWEVSPNRYGVLQERRRNSEWKRTTAVLSNIGRVFPLSPLLDENQKLHIENATLEKTITVAPIRPQTQTTLFLSIYGLADLIFLFPPCNLSKHPFHQDIRFSSGLQALIYLWQWAIFLNLTFSYRYPVCTAMSNTFSNARPYLCRDI